MRCVIFFFQAEDGIRDLVRSRGLGDVYKRQKLANAIQESLHNNDMRVKAKTVSARLNAENGIQALSLIHI